MKVLMINVVCGIRSTGRICTDLATALEKQGHQVKIAYGRENVPEQFQKYAVRIGNDLDVKLHGVKARLLDGAGFGSKAVTKKFIEWVKKYDPDVIHLHNLHGYYINVEILFKYLKTCGKRIIWTLHDCWAFTGHCTYFDYVDCEKWKNGCMQCPQKKEYPTSNGLDMSKQHYALKRKLFTGIPNMTLVTPSQWLADLVKMSYLRKYNTLVIHNGVDTTVFKPTNSNVREKYHCENKKIVLGVAAIWDKRKGLGTFLKLSKRLDQSYQIILVGLTQEQIQKMPKNIIGIERTDSVQELVELYSAADVFVNPTLEDNYPTTNLEAIACGTPVITYDTGGSPESARLHGECVEQKHVKEIYWIIKKEKYVVSNKIDINISDMVEEYLQIYKEI